MPDGIFYKKWAFRLILAVVIFLLFLVIYGNRTSKLVANTGETYNVVDSYEDKQQAANVLAELNSRMIKFLTYLKQKYKINEIGYYEEFGSEHSKKEIVRRILQNYNPEAIYENKPNPRTTAYTLDKGEKFIFCIRDTKTHKIHDTEILMFVALHELSHMGNIYWNHDYDFWQVFKFVLQEAEKAGIHKPVNYELPGKNQMYCGIEVDYNPYFDDSITEIPDF